jgi:hypothetical protein
MQGKGCRIQDSGCNRLRVCILVLVSAVSSLGITGCRKNGEVQIGSESNIDLSERFSLISAEAPDNFQRHIHAIRKGERKDALKLVAPATIRASLQGATGKWILKFWAAPVFDVGDGFLVMVFLRRSGMRFLVGNRYFDPGRKDEDRNWIPIAIPLEIQQGDQLEIEASGGSQGDFTADWLALSSPMLTARQSIQ